MRVNIEKATGRTILRHTLDRTPQTEVTVSKRKPTRTRRSYPRNPKLRG